MHVYLLGCEFFILAQDARERQHWVNRLRATAEYHTDNIAQVSIILFL